MTGATVEFCRDRACGERLGDARPVTGTSLRPDADLPPGLTFWRVRSGGDVGAVSPVWHFFAGPPSTHGDGAWGGHTDINGDGRGDVLRRLPGGRLGVYLAGPQGLPTVPSQTLPLPEGDDPNCEAVGDVNGDGFGDVLLASVDLHRAFLHAGSAAGLGDTPLATLTLEHSSSTIVISPVGDTNGDGFADVFLGNNDTGMCLYLGGDQTLRRVPGVQLENAQGVGDVNGDGLADVASSQEHGPVELHFGTASGTAAGVSASISGPPGLGAFGGTLDAAGDLDGDGYGDLILGTHAGAAAVYLGSPTGPRTDVISALTDPAGAPFGWDVAGAGDVNGDGFADVVVSAGHDTLSLFLGGAGGPRRTPSARIAGPAESSFGFAARVGDVNGDGRDELLTTTREGPDFLYVGGADGLSTARATILGSTAGVFRPIAFAGDVNRDGRPEVIQGLRSHRAALFLASMFDTANQVSPWPIQGVTSVGFASAVGGAGDTNRDGAADVIVGTLGHGAFVYGGSPIGISPFRRELSPPVGVRSGEAVAGIGDVDRDGFADVAVGAPTRDLVYVHQGAAGGVIQLASVTLRGPDGSQFGSSLAGVGDVDRDGFVDVLVGADQEGAVYLYRGSASGLTTQPSATVRGPRGVSFGVAVAGVGDLDRDGFADVAVGTRADRAYVLYGSAEGLSFDGAVPLQGATGSGFGSALAGAGDVDGDGAGDLVVGAPMASTAFVYFGRGRAFRGRLPMAGQPGSFMGGSVSGGHDLNRDGFSDVVASGADGGPLAYFGRSFAPAAATAPSPAAQSTSPSGPSSGRPAHRQTHRRR